MASRGGLVNKKMTKFATMSDYLEAHHPKVYELFTYLGMQGALTPRRGGGLTLLIPDSKTVADLHKTIESDDAEKASDMLSGMVIQDNLGSEKDWAEKQDDIPTLLGKRVPVKSVSAGKVVLDGGAELTLDKSAKFLSRVGRKTRDPMSVWLVKGSFDPTSAPDATYKYVNEGGKSKSKGGKKTGGLAMPDDIWKTHANNSYVEGVLNDVGTWLNAGGVKSGRPNPCAREMVRLINYLMSKKDDPSMRGVIQTLLAFCRGCPVSDFLSVYKNHLGTADFVYNETLLNAMATGFDSGNMRDVYMNFLNLDFPGSGALATSAGRAELDSAVDRYLAVGVGRANINFANKIDDACTELESKNSIAGVSDVFPPEVHKRLATNKGLFLLMEEHFYFICPRWKSIRKTAEAGRTAEAVKMWSELRSDIKLRFDRSKDPSKMTRMDKKEYYSAGGLTDQGLLQNCVTFWRSAFMRWKPITLVEGAFDEDEFDDPFSREITNLRAMGAAELEELPNEDDMGLSERARLELMAYKQKHGKLPDV